MNKTMFTDIDNILKQPVYSRNNNCEWLKVTSPGYSYKLLHGQLTCDMDTVTETHSRFTALCNPKGQVIASFRVFVRDDHYLLRLPAGMATVTKNALDKYAPLFRAEITQNFNRSALTIAGNNCDRVLSQVIGDRPSVVNEVVDNGTLFAVKVSDTPHFELYGPVEAIENSASILAEYCQTMPDNLTKALSVHELIAPVYPETSELLIPHRLGYQHIGAIDFDKGCYTGQEVIARTQFKSNKTFALETAYSNEPSRLSEKIQSENGHYKMLVESVSDGANNHWLLLAP